MKKILALLAVISLNGCAVVDAYFMTGFDGNEYQLITQIRADARHFKNDCANPLLSNSNAVALANETELFMMYSEHVPRNSNVINASKSLNDIAQGLKARYQEATPVSPVFCKLKYESIEHSADTMQSVIGKRPR